MEVCTSRGGAGVVMTTHVLNTMDERRQDMQVSSMVSATGGVRSPGR